MAINPFPKGKLGTWPIAGPGVNPIILTAEERKEIEDAIDAQLRSNPQGEMPYRRVRALGTKNGRICIVHPDILDPSRIVVKEFGHKEEKEATAYALAAQAALDEHEATIRTAKEVADSINSVLEMKTDD